MHRSRTQFDDAPAARGGEGSSALTIVELILSLALLSILGACLAGIMSSASFGLYRQTDIRNAVVSQDSAIRRVGAAVRSSQMVLAQGSNYVVLWLADPNNRTDPYLSTLCRIESNTVVGVLYQFKAPANLGASDTQYPLATTDFATTTANLRGTMNFPATVWCSGVTAFSTTLDANSATLADMVSYTLTVKKNDVTESAVGSGALMPK